MITSSGMFFKRDPFLNIDFLITLTLMLVLISVSSLMFFEFHYIVTFVYITLFGVIILKLLPLRFTNWYIASISLSVLIALYQYKMNIAYFPESEGFMVNASGSMADDKAFLQGVLLFIEDGYIHHSFSVLSAIILYPISLFRQIEHIDALILNALWHSIGAVVTYNIVGTLTFWNKKSVVFSYVLYLFCGMLLLDGLTFMREGAITAFFAIFLLALLKKQTTLLLISISLIGVLRGGAAIGIYVSLVLSAIFLRKNILADTPDIKNMVDKSVLILTTLFFMSAGIIFDYLLSKQMFQDLFFRISFLTEFLKQETQNSAVAFLVNQPGIVRIPGLFTYYVLAPFINISMFGSALPLNLFNALFNLWQIIVYFYVLNFVILSRKIKYLSPTYVGFVQFILIMFMFNVYMISQYSLQLRHKDMLLPILIIGASFAMPYIHKLGKQNVLVLVLLFVSVSVVR